MSSKYRIVEHHTSVTVQGHCSFLFWNWWSTVEMGSGDGPCPYNFRTKEKALAYIIEQLAWNQPKTITHYTSS